MGGSGGSFYRNPKKLTEEVNESREIFFKNSLESEVSNLLSSILANANNRDAEAINLHIKEITRALEKNIEGSVNTLFGGSVAKHTFVDGLSDIDALLIINDSELINKSPVEVKDYIAQRLRERYPQTEIKEGHLAITVKFNDYEIQIIPAVKRINKIRIPAPSGDEWSDDINPQSFTKALTDINSKLNNKVIPVIKLAKSIIYSYPEQKRLSGYHIEALAVNIFKNYTDTPTTVKMLKHFFIESHKCIRQPMKDLTGQSSHIDDYLKGENSLERELRADALRNTFRKMLISTTLEQWKQFFE